MDLNLLRDGKTVSFRNCRDTPGSFRLVQSKPATIFGTREAKLRISSMKGNQCPVSRSSRFVLLHFESVYSSVVLQAYEALAVGCV